MRKLTFNDSLKVARIIKRANIRESLVAAYKSCEKEGASTEEFGIEALFIVFEAAGTDGMDGLLFDLLGDITEKGAEAVKNESIEAIISDFVQIAKENDLTGFFKLVQRSTK